MKILSEEASLLWVLQRFTGSPIALASFALEYQKCPALKNASVDGSVTKIMAQAVLDGFLEKRWKSFQFVYTITDIGKVKRSELEGSANIVAELVEEKK